MARRTGGPPWGADPPPWDNRNKNDRRIDGSYTGRTIPSYMDLNDEYGPLMVLRIQGKDKKPLPAAPFMIRRSIKEYLGANIDSAYKEGNGASYALKVRSPKHFSRLLEMKQLVDGTPVEVVEHPVQNFTKCVVSCRDVVDETTTILETELKEQNVTNVHRITRKGNEGRINTPTLVLTVRGTTKPENIYFGYIRCPTRPYYPSPMQCFNCWAFGHTRPRCKSEQGICGKCSGRHPIPEDRSCPNEKFCQKCNSQEHAIAERCCPFYEAEREVQKIKVDQNCSYPAARRMFMENNGRQSFANVAGGGTTGDPGADSAPKRSREFQLLNNRIDELVGIVKSKDNQIAQLQAALQNGNNTAPALTTLPPDLAAHLAKQEEKYTAIIENLTTQNNQLKDFNNRLCQELQELRAVVKAQLPTIIAPVAASQTEPIVNSNDIIQIQSTTTPTVTLSDAPSTNLHTVTTVDCAIADNNAPDIATVSVDLIEINSSAGSEEGLSANKTFQTDPLQEAVLEGDTSDSILSTPSRKTSANTPSKTEQHQPPPNPPRIGAIVKSLISSVSSKDPFSGNKRTFQEVSPDTAQATKSASKQQRQESLRGDSPSLNPK